MNDSDLINWLSIRLAPDMTRPRFYNLMARFASPENVFGASARDIAMVRGFDQKIAGGLLANRGVDSVKRHAEKLRSERIRMITRDDAEYPINLTQSSLAPPLLFVRGALTSEDRYSIAMVGSRHATQYGRGVAREISGGLARCGMTIISGFARGVDGEAHHAAMKAGGRTIAVLGNGLDVCYPSEHRELAESVERQGALITEYPLGTAPERYNFPERNHVIAALSLGTIVVEAAEKSGSLITARLALEENRFVFAVPGDITRNNSRGANSLIQQGARMVQRPRDVLIEMKDVLRGYLNEEMFEEEAATGNADGVQAKKRSRAKTEQAKAEKDAPISSMLGIEPDNETIAAVTKTDDRLTENPLMAKRPDARATSAPLSDDENYIIELLRHEAMVFDEIAAQSYGRGIDTARLSSLLMKLELKQIIRQLPGRYYVLFV